MAQSCGAGDLSATFIFGKYKLQSRHGLLDAYTLGHTLELTNGFIFIRRIQQCHTAAKLYCPPISFLIFWLWSKA